MKKLAPPCRHHLRHAFNLPQIQREGVFRYCMNPGCQVRQKLKETNSRKRIQFVGNTWVGGYWVYEAKA